jgi:hypothetical protein
MVITKMIDEANIEMRHIINYFVSMVINLDERTRLLAIENFLDELGSF